MNRVEITGRLTKNLEYACDNDGRPYKTRMGGHVAKGSIADQHSKKAGDVSFFDFVCYGQVADRAVQQFKKGELVNIVGWLKQNRWKARDGSGRNRIEVRANEINPVFAKSKTQPPSDDDVPAWAEQDELFPGGKEE